MAGLPHRVRRLTIRVRTGSEEEAFALRGELREELSRALLPTIERAFDAAFPGDDVIVLPRVEASIALDDAASIGDRLPALIQREIEASLRSAIGSRAAVSTASNSSYSDRRSDTRSPTGLQAWAEPLLRAMRHGASGGPGVIFAPSPASSEPERTETEDTRAPLEDREESGENAEASAESRPLHTKPLGSSPGAANKLLHAAESVSAPSLESGGRALFDLLVAYLETGQLPWALAGIERSITALELRGAAREGLARLIDRAVKTPVDRRLAFFFRLAQLLPETDWPALARAVQTTRGQETGPLLTEVVAVLGSAEGISTYLRLQLIAIALGFGLSPEDSALVRAIGAAISTLPTREIGPAGGAPLLAALPEPARSFFMRALSTSESSDSIAPTPSASVPGPRTDVAAQGASRGPDSKPGKTSNTPLHAQPPLNVGAPFPGEITTPLRRAPEVSAVNAPLGHPVSHAGLILLHPYLPRFLASIGIQSVKNAESPRSDVLPDADLPRAAALLHLVATGEDDVAELDLAFIKVLLGLPMTASLPVAPGLVGDADRAEAEALLSAVIGHFTALKKTSVRGLRSSFLARRGLLREEGQGFFLRVEPAPFDMLLAHLPWGLSTVKIPWVKKLIFTEWSPS